MTKTANGNSIWILNFQFKRHLIEKFAIRFWNTRHMVKFRIRYFYSTLKFAVSIQVQNSCALLLFLPIALSRNKYLQINISHWKMGTGARSMYQCRSAEMHRAFSQYPKVEFINANTSVGIKRDLNEIPIEYSKNNENRTLHFCLSTFLAIEYI